MPRGRSDDGEPSWGAFGEQLKNELKSALQLLLRNARLNSVALIPSEVSWTTFQANLSGHTSSIPLNMNKALISPDVVTRLKQMGQLCSSPLLNHLHVSLNTGSILQASYIPTHQTPLICTFDQKTNSVMLPKSQIGQTEFWSVTCPEKPLKASSWPVTCCQTEVKSGFNGLKTKFRPLPLMLSKRFRDTFKTDARFKALPIQKSPIPLHRFSSGARQIFRETLANKYKLGEENIQVLSVFDRVAVRHYAGLEQDKHGHLLCTPKFTKSALAPELEDVQSYLIVGLRLDTKQEIHALMPSSKLKEEDPSPAQQESKL